MMKTIVLTLGLAMGSPLTAGILLDLPYGSAMLDSSDPTMNARIGRDGIPSDWSFQKVFPGLFGGPGPRAYDLYSFNNTSSRERYFQIFLDDQLDTFDVFAASYLGTFDPTDLEANYMGDPGFSPTNFGLPVFYQVIVPAMSTMHVVVNQVSIGPDTLPLAYGILVEDFGTPFYSEIPEPSTWLLSLAGLSWVGWKSRRRQPNS